MVQIETTLLTITTSLVLFFIGIFIGKKGYWLSLSGAMIMMIVGILLFNSPILFKNGANVTSIDATTDQIIYTYQTQDSTLNLVLAWVFMLTGIFGILISSIKLYNLRFDGYKEVEIDN